MDAVTAPNFEKECTSWIGKEEKKVVVDLSGLEYISSAGLRSILIMGKQLKAKGGALVFTGMCGMVKEVFDISGFATLFPAHPSLEKALETIG